MVQAEEGMMRCLEHSTAIWSARIECTEKLHQRGLITTLAVRPNKEVFGTAKSTSSTGL